MSWLAHLGPLAIRPVSGVDVHLAENILNWNMKRYPDGEPIWMLSLIHI